MHYIKYVICICPAVGVKEPDITEIQEDITQDIIIEDIRELEMTDQLIDISENVPQINEEKAHPFSTWPEMDKQLDPLLPQEDNGG